MAATLDAITGTVDETAGLVRGVGDTTAATLGATLRLTGGLTRGLGQAVQTFGETQVIKHGPLAAPSRVFAGVYRIAGAVLTGAGNATIGLGGTVEGITAEAAKVAEDSVKVLSEPTRSLGAALRGQSRQPLPKDDDGAAEERSLPSASSYLVTRPRQRRVAERLARRLLRDAFGTPSERTVALAPPLTLALMVAWMLGRSSRAPNGVRSGSSYTEHLHLEPLISENGDASRQVSEDSQARSRSAKLRRLLRRVRCRRCRPGVWLHCAGLAMLLTVVLSVDQEQQRRARIIEQGLGVYSGVTDEEESIRWFNMVVSAVWTPLQKSVSGLGAELAAMFTFQMTPGEDDALSIAFENVTFGLNPPVLDAVRTPCEGAEQALHEAMEKARDTRGGLRPQVVMMEADLLWVADREFEVLVKASARSAVRSSLSLFPQLRVRLGDLVFGPVPVAVAMEAAPQGYPYVGLVALTFVSEPTVDFSITPENILGGAVSALPLLREALVAGLVSSLPLLTDDQVLVYDLGEYLAPGLFPEPTPAEDTDVEKPGNQHTRSGLFQWLFRPRLWRQRRASPA
ncbi:SYT3 [Symbiodinium natans]|uniref:SYT3 protein n=1 Tax=Symbiodinium natans TaxID=878477 RepID=A0A812N612_9DINO|nr:SYT3 [Symbiodinium natans]